MQQTSRRAAARVAAGLLCAALCVSLVPLAQADANAFGVPARSVVQARLQSAQSHPMPTTDPTFSAYTLERLCARKNDAVAQGQCLGAVRGIIHGYQYGVQFLAQRAQLSAGEAQRASLCLHDVKLSSIIDDYLADANQVDAAALKDTPAEVALLGSVHMHHPCN
ncbi:hypothetical protein QYH69_01155 [Paraburkholderia sp. SARCC-3016]|jgi:hypothetical protein|uniref:hypothetical protein n=1 Tax=Paraburkholderia sp. SARCC-3016 TaxID=3058611 RepID=UPI00280881D8|nr:hypothetical protein [Paraburkholderia sp. SARCC-3016]MDQ7975854.1 hypothetical protein [Paraburkholderia sp. SARCC-3016]